MSTCARGEAAQPHPPEQAAPHVGVYELEDALQPRLSAGAPLARDEQLERAHANLVARLLQLALQLPDARRARLVVLHQRAEEVRKGGERHRRALQRRPVEHRLAVHWRNAASAATCKAQLSALESAKF